MVDGKDASRKLARHAAGLQYDAIPLAMRELTKAVWVLGMRRLRHPILALADGLAAAGHIKSADDLEYCTYTEVGARTRLTETILDDYSYIGEDGEVIYTAIGKFCSIASHTRINPGNHPMQRATQAHFTYRASAYFEGESDDAEFFEWRRAHHIHIGHDVWIGHGAIVLPGRDVGTGAVVASIGSSPAIAPSSRPRSSASRANGPRRRSWG